MIIIGLGCGLGNQMFQYAFYLSMKKRYPEAEIKIDSRYAFIEEHNGIEIDRVFGITIPKCKLEERRKFSEIPLNKSILARLFFKIRNTTGIHKKSFYKQRDYTEYYPEVYDFNEKENKYLLGVWGNERYFRDFRKEIQEQIFIFQLPLNDNSERICQHIRCVESVSVHVRKGDFVQYKNHIMGSLYYKKAMEYIESYLENEVYYFVFSDEMDYARSLFDGMSNVKYVTGNCKNENWMDMYLMSICKHNIITNSSFGFWGAYLNRNDNKVVIAPNQSFGTCKNPFTCEEWILIDET